MKLIVCCDAFLPANREGGPPFSTFNLCGSLANQGVEVGVVTTNRNGSGRLRVPTDCWTTYDGIPVWYARSLPGPYYPAPSAARALRELAPQAACLLNSGTLWTHLGYMAWRASARFGVPMVTYLRGLLDPWALAFKPGRKRVYWTLLGRRILRSSAAVVALTEHERETMEKLGVARRIEVIPNGVDVTEFANPPSRSFLVERFPALRDRRYILFLGRIHEKKGLDLVFRALSRLGRHAEHLAVVVAGPVDEAYRKRFERLLDESPLRGQVILTGQVSGAIKAALLRHAEAFTLPSYSEGLPMAVLEALASGCPVVVTRQCNLPEVSHAGAGFEIEPDADALAQALVQILSSRDLRQNMAINAVQLAHDKFDWGTVGARTLDLCRSLTMR